MEEKAPFSASEKRLVQIPASSPALDTAPETAAFITYVNMMKLWASAKK